MKADANQLENDWGEGQTQQQRPQECHTQQGSDKRASDALRCRQDNGKLTRVQDPRHAHQAQRCSNSLSTIGR